MNANQKALMVDSVAREIAVADTLKQAADWHGQQTPGYAATFYCVYQCISPDTTQHYSFEEWFYAIATNTTWKLGNPMTRRF